MVLDPAIGTTRRSVRFSRVLIDGGSSINISTATPPASGHPGGRVAHPHRLPWHRAGRCQPIGRITLEVMFGKPDHFRTENRSKQNYPHYQKVTYGVYMAAKKLKHYFQEHPIKVVATTPLAEIIGSKDANGRVAKWALELAAHTILRATHSHQVAILADFFVEWAEMRAALAKEIGVRRILCFGDSDLVIQQASGDAKDANMASYRFHVQQLSGFFEGCEFHHVPRANNGGDALSKIGSTGKPFRRASLAVLKQSHTVTGLGFNIRAG
ncbi:hypothetical protein QYE76_057426 [Lolium multiflorum]|uniref:RNase H type-1 domain-containing protein n=1 Tax=Lolium multiflorum TaxID=4521 RepID=A0AAD8T3E0_LOLMU|nr:hypothetical protein QYE76_057426 [Lolium multiflorum]